MSKNTKTARATLRIFTGGFTPVKGGLTASYIETDVAIIYETPECFRIQYSKKFEKKHPDLCESVILRKDDNKRQVTYTVFTATDDLPAISPTRHARLTINVIYPMNGAIGFGCEKTDVLIVEETETHYRLRFTTKFAKEHPNLCKEWVSKDSKDPKIEIMN